MKQAIFGIGLGLLLSSTAHSMVIELRLESEEPVRISDVTGYEDASRLLGTPIGFVQVSLGNGVMVGIDDDMILAYSHLDFWIGGGEKCGRFKVDRDRSSWPTLMTASAVAGTCKAAKIDGTTPPKAPPADLVLMSGLYPDSADNKYHNYLVDRAIKGLVNQMEIPDPAHPGQKKKVDADSPVCTGTCTGGNVCLATGFKNKPPVPNAVGQLPFGTTGKSRFFFANSSDTTIWNIEIACECLDLGF